MKINLFTTLSFFAMASFFACNPDCESYGTVTAEVSPKIRQITPGQATEVRIATIPSDFLTDREIFIDRTVRGEKAFEQLDSRMLDNGRAVMLPMDVATGETTFFVRDTDCDGFIPLSTANIVDEDFALGDRSLFVTPAPPLIVIPQLQVTPPTNVVKTWFSVNDRDYCLWIVPDLEINENGDTIRELPNLVPGKPELFDMAGTVPGTREISVSLLAGCTPPSPYSELFHFNPVTGVVDHESGFVSLTIDRTAKGFGLGIERYEGTLIDPSSIQEEYQLGGPPCTEVREAKDVIMVLTSLKTGRQLILYRQA